ncbi:hypothetical protein KIPB_012681, partial [Kipferlia bialata]
FALESSRFKALTKLDRQDEDRSMVPLPSEVFVDLSSAVQHTKAVIVEVQRLPRQQGGPALSHLAPLEQDLSSLVSRLSILAAGGDSYREGDAVGTDGAMGLASKLVEAEREGERVAEALAERERELETLRARLTETQDRLEASLSLTPVVGEKQVQRERELEAEVAELQTRLAREAREREREVRQIGDDARASQQEREREREDLRADAERWRLEAERLARQVPSDPTVRSPPSTLSASMAKDSPSSSDREREREREAEVNTLKNSLNEVTAELDRSALSLAEAEAHLASETQRHTAMQDRYAALLSQHQQDTASLVALQNQIDRHEQAVRDAKVAQGERERELADTTASLEREVQGLTAEVEAGRGREAELTQEAE